VQHFQLADFVRLTLAAYRGQPVGQV
jgi:hypothetical protein